PVKMLGVLMASRRSSKLSTPGMWRTGLPVRGSPILRAPSSRPMNTGSGAIAARLVLPTPEVPTRMIFSPSPLATQGSTLNVLATRTGAERPGAAGRVGREPAAGGVFGAPGGVAVLLSGDGEVIFGEAIMRTPFVGQRCGGSRGASAHSTHQRRGSTGVHTPRAKSCCPADRCGTNN